VSEPAPKVAAPRDESQDRVDRRAGMHSDAQRPRARIGGALAVEREVPPSSEPRPPQAESRV